MLDSQEVEKNLLNAQGKFEYTVDGGVVVIPVNKYAHFFQNRTYTVFIGRDTDSDVQQTGVHLLFTYDKSLEFWGVDAPPVRDLIANFYNAGEVWGSQAGSITGMFSSSQRAAFFQFDFTAQRNSQVKHIKGRLLLKESDFSSLIDSV